MSGDPKRSQATPSDPQRSQAIPGDPKQSHAISSDPQRSWPIPGPGDPKRSQAIPSDPRRSQAIPSDPKGSRAIPADPKRSQSQAIPNDPKRSQAIPSDPRRNPGRTRDSRLQADKLLVRTSLKRSFIRAVCCHVVLEVPFWVSFLHLFDQMSPIWGPGVPSWKHATKKTPTRYGNPKKITSFGDHFFNIFLFSGSPFLYVFVVPLF